MIEYSKETSGTIVDAINFEEAALKKLSSGTNMHAGLIMANEWLEADSEVPNDMKYVFFLLDGKTYIWNNEKNEPTTVYTQYQGSKGALYPIPSVGQATGSYSKSAFKHKDKYYYDYTTTGLTDWPFGNTSAVTVSDMTKCFYSPYYEDIYKYLNHILHYYI